MVYNIASREPSTQAEATPRKLTWERINWFIRTRNNDFYSIVDDEEHKDYAKVVVNDYPLCQSADHYASLDNLRGLCNNTRSAIEKAITGRLEAELEKYPQWKYLGNEEKGTMIENWRHTMLKDIEDSGIKIAISTNPQAQNPLLFKVIAALGLILQEDHLILKQKQFLKLAQQLEHSSEGVKKSFHANILNVNQHPGGRQL